MKLEHLMMVLGGALLAIGLVLGLMPVNELGVSCGTAFTGQSDDAAVADLAGTLVGGSGLGEQVGDLSVREHACESSLASRRAPALALAVPGALLLGGGFVRQQSQVRL